METLGTLGLSPITLKSGNFHTLGDAHSSSSNYEAAVNGVVVPYVNWSKVIVSYVGDQFFLSNCASVEW